MVDVDAFDRGQLGWREPSNISGFLGQCGGWSRREPHTAHVFAWWNGQRDHQQFMAGTHGHLAASQAGTYDTIQVRLWDHHQDIGPGFPAGCATGSVVRLAHCQVKVGRHEHFAQAQAEVWNPGMLATPGMRGGVFARRAQTEFLVLSLWNSEKDHERYSTDFFPELRHRSGAADDLDDIVADLIEIDPRWTVMAGGDP